MPTENNHFHPSARRPHAISRHGFLNLLHQFASVGNDPHAFVRHLPDDGGEHMRLARPRRHLNHHAAMAVPCCHYAAFDVLLVGAELLDSFFHWVRGRMWIKGRRLFQMFLGIALCRRYGKTYPCSCIHISIRALSSLPCLCSFYAMPFCHSRAPQCPVMPTAFRRGTLRKPSQYFAGSTRVLCGKYSNTSRRAQFRSPHGACPFTGVRRMARRRYFACLPSFHTVWAEHELAPTGCQLFLLLL